MARQRSKNPWTADQVRARGLSTNFETAASIFGLSRTVAYDLLRRGEFPVPTFKVGRRIVVPVPEILRRFGVDVDEHDVHQPGKPTLHVVADDPYNRLLSDPYNRPL